MSPAALDLAEGLLAYDPSHRINALQAMDTPYFTTERPPATPPIGFVNSIDLHLLIMLTKGQAGDFGRRVARVRNQTRKSQKAEKDRNFDPMTLLNHMCKIMDITSNCWTFYNYLIADTKLLLTQISQALSQSSAE
jgi:hypothetical protein